MTGLLDHEPSVGAYRAAPYTIAEIDAHPDADRIWSTILSLRAEMEDRETDAYWKGHRNGRELGSD